jgi:hypothetical protein
VEYCIPYDIGILEEIGIQVEFRILWNTAEDIIRYGARKKWDRSEDTVVVYI